MESGYKTVNQIGVPLVTDDITRQNEIKNEELIHLFSHNGSFGENTTSLSGAVGYKGRRKQA